MNILFVTGMPHIPQSLGGVPSSTHELATMLMERGHEVAVTCGLVASSALGYLCRGRLRMSGRPYVRDHLPGYPVYRQWDVRRNIQFLVRELDPDIAIVQLGELVPLAQELRKCRVPTIIYLHNAAVTELHGDPSTLTGIQYIANSNFTANRHRQAVGIESIVVPPLFRPQRYVATRIPTNVTFVNPLPIKGSDIAFEIARRCPDIPFCFVESWLLDKAQKRRIRDEIKKAPNVSFRLRTADVRKIYSRAKIMLVPSKIEETWGRVVSEGHFNGIPAVASDRGALPELVGPGGILLDPDGP